jgi:hypothetical protein
VYEGSKPSKKKASHKKKKKKKKEGKEKLKLGEWGIGRAGWVK